MLDAVVPDKSAFLDVVKQIKAEQKVDKVNVSSKDASYYEMSKMSGWTNLRRFIETRKENLLTSLDQSIVGEDLAQIGTKYVIVRQIISELDNIIKTVEKSSNFVGGLEDANGSTTNK